LIYLAFGIDYPTGIAIYFVNLLKREHFKKIIPRVLTQPNKISSVIKKMAEDKLVTLKKQEKVRAGPRKYYEINPQILQSPIRDSTTYTKRDGSPLVIPPETIASFLGWLAQEQSGTIDKNRLEHDEQLRQERHKRADEFFEGLLGLERASYITFLFFIAYEATKWDSQRKASNQQPSLSMLILDYIHELIKTPSELFTEYFTFFKAIKASVEDIEEIGGPMTTDLSESIRKVENLWKGLERISNKPIPNEACSYKSDLQ
jgi:hypothetical protein